MMKMMLKQLSKDVPTTNRARAKDQKSVHQAVAIDPKKPTLLQAMRAGSRP